MTIGTGLIILSLTEHIQNKLTDIFVVYGKCAILLLCAALLHNKGS